jgi:hypothetical protein
MEKQQGFMKKKELQKFVLKGGECAGLLREIYNATVSGGQITIKFESGIDLKKDIVIWKEE